MVTLRWTNRSVLAFAEGRDPVDAVTERARAIAMDAMDSGWSGPPFDPLALADFLRIEGKLSKPHDWISQHDPARANPGTRPEG